ncbi:multidrug efflux ABC transporter permease [Fodinibacter luteus]|uniref:Multidrug efflux ABC transporter permease n=1 Tax=Fodinibacter luteus TaxID=552064 RepID=A0ABP8K0X5_9MICO
MTAAAPTAPTTPTVPPATSTALATRLAGVTQLFRLAWRRDRILVPASVVGLVALSVGSARATLALYPDDESAAAGLAGIFTNPSVVAMYGPLASPTADALAVFKTVMMGAFLTAVLGLVVVRRHTRTEEDEGRLELLGSGVVGRWSPLAAAVGLACLAVVAASVLSGAGLAALGMDAAGSAAFAVAWLAAGLATVGVTAVAVQLASTTRGAAGLGFGFLAAVYALRALADSADEGTLGHALGWLSPLGWAGRVEAYGANRQWVLLLGVGTLVLGVAVGLAVLERRDLGAGIIPARSGPSRAGRTLSSPLGLVTRLARGTIIGWTVGITLGGVVIGSLLGAIAGLADDAAIQDFLRLLGGDVPRVEDLFVATELRFVAVGVAAVGIALVLRLVGSERSGLGEVVLTTPASRTSWYAAHVVVPLALSAALLALFGLVIGLVGPLATPLAPTVGASVAAALSTLPAVWVVVGVAAALAGAAPRFAPVAWAVLLVSFVVGELGDTMNLPGWLVDASPFAHLSQLPGGSFEATGAVALSLLAAALIGFGWVAYQRRDVV